MSLTAILETEHEHDVEVPNVDGRAVRTAEAPGRTLGHEELLTLARKVRAAAEDGDESRFQRASRRFQAELDRHLRSEDHDLGSLPDSQRAELAAGQEELREIAATLAATNPACLGVSRRRPALLIVGQLQYQRDRERRALATRRRW